MSRFVRIRTVWRKELTDTLRDRRTLIAMVVVPILLYPALMLGSFQAFELQRSQAVQQEFIVAVPDEATATWLRARIDSDLSRRLQAAGVPAEKLPELEQQLRDMTAAELRDLGGLELAEDQKAQIAQIRPYAYQVKVVAPPENAVTPEEQAEYLRAAVRRGEAAAAVMVRGDLPTYLAAGTSAVTLYFDATRFESQAYAARGLEGILERLADFMIQRRLTAAGVDQAVLEPIRLNAESVATSEQEAGFRLGMILPLILITMTISGAIYPAIDLTAGERERGTLETLMVAPVPTLDLIAGKFLVVTLIGMLSAVLNLLAMGATMYFGGIGQALTGSQAFAFPLSAIPLTLLVMIPMAVMFSAILLAVCSFARSFKEAQNYVMPVLVAAMVPAIVGLLPGSRLEGPLIVLPVTNIVLLMRDLFVGRIDVVDITLVAFSTTLYASAAVAIAAKLFGQEAVLFADSGSFRTLFIRKFYQPRRTPTVAQGFLLLAVLYLLNFFVQAQLQQIPGLAQDPLFFFIIGATLIVLFIGVPLLAALYSRVHLRSGFGWRPPPALGWVAAICFGLSTWILAQAWLGLQQQYLTMPDEVMRAFSEIEAVLQQLPPLWLIILVAVIPAIAEEVFFRGYALRALQGGLGWTAAIVITAIAFGLNHHSVHRVFITVVLGLVFGLLAMRSASIWPAILAHLMHNGISVASRAVDGLRSFLEALGMPADPTAAWPAVWLIVAAALALLGLLLCLRMQAHRDDPAFAPEPRVAAEPAVAART